MRLPRRDRGFGGVRRRGGLATDDRGVPAARTAPQGTGMTATHPAERHLRGTGVRRKWWSRSESCGGAGEGDAEQVVAGRRHAGVGSAPGGVRRRWAAAGGWLVCGWTRRGRNQHSEAVTTAAEALLLGCPPAREWW